MHYAHHVAGNSMMVMVFPEHVVCDFEIAKSLIVFGYVLAMFCSQAVNHVFLRMKTYVGQNSGHKHRPDAIIYRNVNLPQDYLFVKRRRLATPQMAIV